MKSKEKQDETSKYQEIYISSEKRQQMIDALGYWCFRHYIKMEHHLIMCLDLLLKKWIGVHDQSRGHTILRSK